MRFPPLVSAFAWLGLLACGGAVTNPTGTPDPDDTTVGEKTPPKSAGSSSGDDTSTDPRGHPTPIHSGPSGPIGSECPKPTNALVTAGGLIVLFGGSALSLQLTYQGSAIGVTEVRTVDKTLVPSVGPFAAGTDAGYWADVLDRSTGARLYTQSLQDPTHIEGIGEDGFSQILVDKCQPKLLLLDIPHSAPSTIVIYGSPYGTSDAAVELARFQVSG